MADGIVIPASGVGTATPKVMTLDKGTPGHAQVITIDAGSGASSVPIIAGPQASSTCLPVVGPNDDQISVSVDITRPANTTAYAINDAIADAGPTAGGFILTNMGKSSGGSGHITSISVMSNNDPATPLQLEVFIFSQPVTAIADNAAFAVSDSEVKTLLDVVFIALQDVGNNGWGKASGLWIPYSCVGSADLRFLLRAKNAYTPASGEVLTVIVTAIRQ